MNIYVFFYHSVKFTQKCTPSNTCFVLFFVLISFYIDTQKLCMCVCWAGEVGG